MNWMMKLYKLNPINIWLFFLFLLYACNVSQTNKQANTAALPYYNEASFTPNWLAPTTAELDTFHQIAPFELINQEGELITRKTFDGKIYVTDFFFTSCPGICPRMTDNMLVLQEAFINDDEVLLLSHSVTPERDSVPILKAYAEKKGILSHKWHIVTGSQNEIYKLGRKAYFVEEDLGATKEIDEFLHTENFVLIDKNKHIRGIYNGLNKSSINQLIADIQSLKKEK